MNSYISRIQYIYDIIVGQDHIGSMISNQSEDIFEEAAKIWLFPTENCIVDKSIKNIFNSLYHVNRCWRKNSFPSKKFIYQNSYLDNKHFERISFDLALDSCRWAKVDEIRLEDKEGFHVALSKYFQWISENLSKFGVLSYRKVKSCLCLYLRDNILSIEV